MMRHLHFIAKGFIVLLCTLFVSCIDGHEEVWLNGDGSGRAEFNYDIPAAAAKFQKGEEGIRDLVASLLKDMPSASHEVKVVDDRIKIKVNVSFASPDELTILSSSATEARAPASFDYLAGKFDITQSFRTVDFTRTIVAGKALPVAIIPSSQFRNHKLTYIIHLPVKPKESSATRTADDGKTLIWEPPLTAAIRQPIVIHFKADFPIPMWLMVTAAGAVLLMVVGIALLRVRAKRR